MSEVQLLGKSEVWVEGVDLDGVDLSELAAAAAGSLGLARDKVFVTDVRDRKVVFDVLVPRLPLENVLAKQGELLAAMGGLPGVSIDAAARVHSEGVLGAIGSSREHASRVLDEARKIERGIRDYASRRAAVVTTGVELLEGRVRDTNFEAVSEILGEAGFEVVFGGAVGDDEDRITGLIARLAGEAYGLIISTGGVGAEDKDRTLEAMERLDPSLSTATLATYTKGQGRHVKDSVRIAVAALGWTTIVALPGPTHEVRLALPVLLESFGRGDPPAVMVEELARPLRESLRRHTGRLRR